MNSYLTFVQLPPTPQRVTAQWDVINKNSGTVLGSISWYGAWRQYCFFTLDDIVFSTSCLEEINTFIKGQNRRHAEKLKARKGTS